MKAKASHIAVNGTIGFQIVSRKIYIKNKFIQISKDVLSDDHDIEPEQPYQLLFQADLHFYH